MRGARNIPCETVPGKRAPTVKLCESNEQYVPLNEGYNWKGDPNATLSGQDVPQLPPGSLPPVGGPPAPAPPIAAAPYDPATGTYLGPDGHQYTRSDLAQTAPKDKTWQTMLLPPGQLSAMTHDGDGRGPARARGLCCRTIVPQPKQVPAPTRPVIRHRHGRRIDDAVVLVGISCPPVATGTGPAQSIPACGQAGRAEPDDHRLAARRRRCAPNSGRRDRRVLQRLRAGAQQPFIEVLQQAKAATVGTIAEAGLKSQTADTAQALVAVSVRTSNAGEADPVPRYGECESPSSGSASRSNL